jgi:hypothetical protein
MASYNLEIEKPVRALELGDLKGSPPMARRCAEPRIAACSRVRRRGMTPRSCFAEQLRAGQFASKPSFSV